MNLSNRNTLTCVDYDTAAGTVQDNHHKYVVNLHEHDIELIENMTYTLEPWMNYSIICDPSYDIGDKMLVYLNCFRSEDYFSQMSELLIMLLRFVGSKYYKGDVINQLVPYVDHVYSTAASFDFENIYRENCDHDFDSLVMFVNFARCTNSFSELAGFVDIIRCL